MIIVYHEVDAATPAVAFADVAIKISGRTPVSAYLDAEHIITVARSLCAGALHRGSGSLSENAGFARAVAMSGIALYLGGSASDCRNQNRPPFPVRSRTNPGAV